MESITIEKKKLFDKLKAVEEKKFTAEYIFLQLITSTPFNETEEIKQEQIGVLNTPQGQVGYKIAEINHPVFEKGDKYIIYLEPLNKTLPIKEVCYYKQTLKPVINFICQ